MNKKHNLGNLVEQEKLLYLEVEQLRSVLFLQDNSPLFELFSAFYFALQSIKNLFVQKKKLFGYEARKKSITSLVNKKKALTLLSKTPYAWIIYSVRAVIRTISSNKNGKIFEPQKKSYLILGTTAANDLQSRSVQIAKKLAENNKVIYIEGIFDEGNKIGFRIIEKSKRFIAIRLTAKKLFHLNYQKPSQKEVAFLKQSFKILAKDCKSFITYLHHPVWYHIAPLKKKNYYFDHADDFTHLHNAAKHTIVTEKKVIKNASIITAPHNALLRNKKDIVIENGVDWKLFKNTSKMIETCDVGLCWIKKPVMGFIGTIDERMDEILLEKLAAAFPNASIVLVGNTDYRPIIEVAEQNKNIFPVGKQQYKKLPLFLQSFDILIIPYKSFSQGYVDHPELPLYLASGKPIVQTFEITRSLQQYKKFIYYPKNYNEWTLTVAEALKEKKRSRKKYLRMILAKKLTWKMPKMIY